LVSARDDLDLLRRIKGKRFPGWKQFFLVKKILSPNEKKIVLVCAGTIFLGFILLGVNMVIANSQKVPDVGGRYTEAVVGSPQLINPIFSSINDVDTDIVKLVFSGLMRYDKEQNLAPDLAESYTLSEDKKVYTFYLRKNVFWHDGRPFTARDVAFTIQAIQDKAVGSPLLISFQGVGVEVVDDYTIKFSLSESFAPFLGIMTVGIISEEKWFDILPERMKLHGQNLQPVGTGPFMFKKLSKNDSGYVRNYELIRFRDYYAKPPYIEDFVFKFFSEYEGPEGAIQALRSQRVSGLNFVPHDLREKVERKHIQIHTLQLPQYTALFFNQNRNAELKENKLKTALQHAIDKERLLRETLKNEGQVIYSPILPGFPGYNPEVPRAEYSPSKANELLDELWPRLPAEKYVEEKMVALIKKWQEDNPTATSTEASADEALGAPPDESAREAAQEEYVRQELAATVNEAQVFYRKNKDGKLLEINLVTVNTPEYKKAAEFIAGFWQEVGVKVNITYAETKDFSRAILKNRDYDVLFYGLILGGDPDQLPFWHSNQTEFPGLNLAGYVNRNADALLEKIRTLDNEEEIIELYKKFQDIILNEKPAIFLYMPIYTYATTDEVRGIDVVRISYPVDRFANVTEWYLETKRQWK